MAHTTTRLTPIATHAVRAARCWHIWGRYAARRYCEKHGVPSGLITLARVLANAERAGL